MNREIEFRGKSEVEIGKNIIQVGEWVYGGIDFDEDRIWIDTPIIGTVLADKNTIRTIYRD